MADDNNNDSSNENQDTTAQSVDPTAQTKTAKTSFKFSGESGGYQAYKPGEWCDPYEIMFSEFTITETDLRVKTATWKSPQYVDLTKGRACVWIQRKYGENFGGVIISCEFDSSTGLYNYEAQDWNRLLTSKVYVILAGDTKVYDIVKKLLVKCNLSTVGLKSIDSYNNIMDEVPSYDDPEESLENSSSDNNNSNSNSNNNDNNNNNNNNNNNSSNSSGTQYTYSVTPLPTDLKKNEEKKAKRNPFYKKPEGLYDKLTARDFIMALVMKQGVNIDVHMNEHGVLRFDPYKKDDWRKERWYFVDTDVYDAKLKFDLTDVITQVAVKHVDPLDGDATLYTSEKLIGVNLAAFFGVMGTVIDNPTKQGSSSGNSVSGDCMQFTGMPSCGCCKKANGGTQPPYSWFTRAYKNYCPLCGKSGTFSDTPKGKINGGRGNVPEHEITCDMKKGGCDADYCIYCGYDKSGKCLGPLTPCGGATPAADPGGNSSNTTTASSSSNSNSTSANATATNPQPVSNSSGGSTATVEDLTKNKMAARIAFSESIRKWFTFTFKVPGEYPKLHTNSFCMVMMSKKFALENMPTIGKKLNGKFTRYLGYEKNRFYIEGVTVTYDESRGLYTELKLNPFASDYSTFAKTQMQAYSALQAALGGGGSVGNANGTDCNDDHGRTFKISTWSMTPDSNNLVTIGNSSANYAQLAKLGARGAMNALKQKFKYQGYEDNQYGAEKCPQKMFAMNPIRGNCADISWLAKCILDCCGVENYIKHAPRHYYNRFKENGQWVHVDICRGDIWGRPWSGE